jgi:hypothetical protein
VQGSENQGIMLIQSRIERKPNFLQSSDLPDNSKVASSFGRNISIDGTVTMSFEGVSVTKTSMMSFKLFQSKLFAEYLAPQFDDHDEKVGEKLTVRLSI